jgi:folate-binding Fe-S cluster repair protein YgfZ
MIKMNHGILSSHQYPDEKTGLTPNHRAFIKMLGHDTLTYLHHLSTKIVEHATVT